MGLPKSLLADADGRALLDVVARRMLASGCAGVTVVLGAEAVRAARLLPPDLREAGVEVVVAEDWADGMGRSLATGLAAVEGGPASAVLVSLVDLPDVDEPVMRRVVDAWRAAGAHADALVRATYAGTPGHPVLIGRDHWEPLRGTLTGDVGAQPYLRARKVLEVSCEDLSTGRDVDRPSDLGRI